MFTKFLRHGTSIASFAPSSRFIARALLKGIDFEKARCIIELGAGTGPITKVLLQRARPHTKVVVIEREPDFCTRLRQRFPGADIVQADAAQLDDLLAERGIAQADHVISGLPLPSFPADLRDSIIAASVSKLAPEGTFRQITAMPWVYYRLYRRYFTDVRFKLVPLNLPPGGVYICRGYQKS
jgi:phospholipid N-methyltransferase